MRASSWREWASQHLSPSWCWEIFDVGEKTLICFHSDFEKKNYLKLKTKKKSHNQISESASLLSLHTLFPTDTDEWKQNYSVYWNSFLSAFSWKCKGKKRETLTWHRTSKLNSSIYEKLRRKATLQFFIPVPAIFLLTQVQRGSILGAKCIHLNISKLRVRRQCLIWTAVLPTCARGSRSCIIAASLPV